LSDEEFPVICSPFEGRFHSIDFSFSTWTLGALVQEVAGRHPALKRSAWTPSMTVHPHFKHWLDQRQVQRQLNSDWKII